MTEHETTTAVRNGKAGYTTIPAWVEGVDWLSVQPVDCGTDNEAIELVKV